MLAHRLALFVTACVMLGGCELKKDASVQLCERNAQKLPRHSTHPQIEYFGYVAICMENIGLRLTSDSRCQQPDNWTDPNCYERVPLWRRGAPNGSETSNIMPPAKDHDPGIAGTTR